MKVISSQRYINYSIVADIIQDMVDTDAKKITLPVIDTGIQDDAGDNLYILIDGHHRYTAARELGVMVVYEIDYRHEYARYAGSEDILIIAHMGDDYYYVDTGVNVWQ